MHAPNADASSSRIPAPPAASPRRSGRAYPRPPHVRPWAKTDVRPVLPLQAPPCAPLPALPSAPRQPSFASTYALSTHLIPGAYPRTHPHAPAPAPGPPDETAAARRARVQQAVKDVVRTRALYEAGALGAQGSTAPLWCALNRYVRRDLAPDRPRGVTLFFAHASSFPKEVSPPCTLPSMPRSHRR
jgi:hypothetical protein